MPEGNTLAYTRKSQQLPSCVQFGRPGIEPRTPGASSITGCIAWPIIAKVKSNEV